MQKTKHLGWLLLITVCIIGLVHLIRGTKEERAKRLFEELQREERHYYEGYHSPAAGRLAQLGEPAVLFLEEGMRSSDPYVMGWSRVALSHIGAASVPALERLVTNEILTTRKEALLALAFIDNDKLDKETGEKIRQIFYRSLQDKEPEIRQWAVYGLAAFANPEAVQNIIIALQDPSPIVRKQAALSLRTTHDSIAGSYLLQALHDENGNVREAVVKALKFRREKGAITAWLSLQNDPSSDVRVAAVMAFHNIRDLRLLSCMAKFFDDKHRSVRFQAARGINILIGGKTSGGDELTIEAKSWWEETGQQIYGNLKIPDTPVAHVDPSYISCLNKILPKGWEVLWTDKYEPPVEWKKINESNSGIQIHLWNPSEQKEKKAQIDVYLIPFIRTKKNDHEEILEVEKLINSKETFKLNDVASKVTTYCIDNHRRIIVFSYNSLGKWSTAVEDICNTFKQTCGQ